MKRGVVLALLLAAAATAQNKRLPWEKPRPIGQDLYREHCVVCHDLDGKKTKKPGPSLHRLFKNEKLPLSGGKPSREYVEVKIKFGGDLMPPFIKRLTDAEVKVLIAYLETK